MLKKERTVYRCQKKQIFDGVTLAKRTSPWLSNSMEGGSIEKTIHVFRHVAKRGGDLGGRFPQLPNSAEKRPGNVKLFEL